MNTVKPIIWMMLCILLGSSGAIAQHDEIEQVAFLEGEWQVSSIFRLGDGKMDTTRAISKISKDLRDKLLIERYAGTRAGSPFSAISLIAYNGLHGRFQKLWTDSEHGALLVYEGIRDSTGLHLNYEFELRGTKLTLQHRYSQIQENSFLLESRRTRDAGETWRVVWTARYERLH